MTREDPGHERVWLGSEQCEAAKPHDATHRCQLKRGHGGDHLSREGGKYGRGWRDAAQPQGAIVTEVTRKLPRPVWVSQGDSTARHTVTVWMHDLSGATVGHRIPLPRYGRTPHPRR